ncbi:MAG: hypothetical protein D4R64_05360 [Porphyromonadaceae bacterium]|nr:MAG: hypothetical protein D4R64_05360 [Porphyromonadaceae bacterium]
MQYIETLETKSTFYTTALKDQKEVFQGDGFREMQFVTLPDMSSGKKNGIIISNTCDLYLHDRLMSVDILYAPVVSFSSYQALLRKYSSKTPQSLDDHFKTIREQRLSHILFLPEFEGVMAESLVLLDQIIHIPRKYFFIGEDI